MTAPAPPPSWADLDFFREDWPALWRRLAAERDWQPPPERIFRALELTPRPAVRVVILGQDPYPAAGRATGLAFAFPPGERPRHSLANILREVADDTGRAPASGDLEGWARQGVLLLNTVLTVPVGHAGGHRGLGWQRLTREVLAAVAGDGPRAFLIWGNDSQNTAADLPRDGHLFLEAAHPSPLSAYRGFLGARPFSAVNEWLAARGAAAIDWSRAG